MSIPQIRFEPEQLDVIDFNLNCIETPTPNHLKYQAVATNAPAGYGKTEIIKELLSKTWVVNKNAPNLQYEDQETRSLMMLPADIAIRDDTLFRKSAEVFARDNALFFKRFSAAFAKLMELGVPREEKRAWQRGFYFSIQ